MDRNNYNSATETIILNTLNGEFDYLREIYRCGSCTPTSTDFKFKSTTKSKNKTKVRPQVSCVMSEFTSFIC